jgi:hypothetical protein
MAEIHARQMKKRFLIIAALLITTLLYNYVNS